MSHFDATRLEVRCTGLPMRWIPVLRILGGENTEKDEKDQARSRKLTLVLEAARFMIEQLEAVFL